MMQGKMQDLIIEQIENDDLENAEHSIQEYCFEYGKDEFYYMASSDVLLANEEYDYVIELMNDALEDGIENDIVYERLGDAYFGLQDFENAIQNFKQCHLEQDDPNLMHTIYMIGLSYFHLQDYDHAISYFEDVLLENETPEVLYNCAVSYLCIGKVSRAMDYFEKLLDNDYLIEPICQELIFTNCFDEADQIAQKTNMISSASLSRIKADYLFTNNRLDEALPYILEALKEINSDALKYNLASIYEKNNDFDNANILFHEIIENYELKDDEPFDFVLAHTEALKHLNISNIQYLRCLEPYVQDNCGAFTLLLKFALDHDLYDYQDYLLNDVNHAEPESDSEYIFYMMILLDIHLEHKRYEMVVDIFDHIPKEYQTYFLTHKLKALYQLEDYEGVIGMYDDVMPDGYNAIIILKACLKLERYSVSNRLFNDMLQVDPEKVEGKKIFWEYVVDHVDSSFNLE